MNPQLFREMREQLGLSQDQLAKMLGVSSGRTVRRWELGERKISVTTERLLQIILDGATWRDILNARRRSSKRE